MPAPEREVPCAARGASPRAWGPVKVGAPKSREALGRRRGHLVSVKLDLLQSVQTGVSHPLARIRTPCVVFRRGLLWMEENYAPLACRKRAPRSDGAERFPAPPGNVACGRPGDPHPRAPSGTQARTQSGAGPKWRRPRLGPAPNGAGPKWGRFQMGPVPHKSPLWGRPHSLRTLTKSWFRVADRWYYNIINQSRRGA